MNVTQISVFLENRAGQLSNITKVLSENDIDLRAINIAETQDYGVLRIIPADAQKASRSGLSDRSGRNRLRRQAGQPETPPAARRTEDDREATFRFLR